MAIYPLLNIRRGSERNYKREEADNLQLSSIALTLGDYPIDHNQLRLEPVTNLGHVPIYVGLGANLPHPEFGSPKATLEAALNELGRREVVLERLSPWYRSAPVPASDQPWFVNAVAEISTGLSADALLAQMHAVEEAFGRVRSVTNAARRIDLDLLDFRGQIAVGGPGRATLPHPRLAERAFVLRPLADLAPGWRHPETQMSIQALVAALPSDQMIERL
ncbi:2-amino-4-hydroxy-6-hydroxymethyldihydropteridine diphosphokinase [Enhydrobacter sp.]|jgi:2-amino-4-hydroxy-6-hydroxymethyldihydropteridine diphosphokinase|uniref:2-amino-4-hydroxy-6- hydroxymethyldihydropteridine diphosphokinase n=1 Tax=Enhydrobacter sp. TaxID=1894999 RepID=UPI00261B9A56|nr:2-amino-4-hydroxy-6-hydroxymethyldihydropteridine diphosphokinase [Enhydrobacter sp.]